MDQTLKLSLIGADLSGKGTLWRPVSADSNGQNPGVSKLSIDSIPDSLTLPRFSVNIYELLLK